MRTRRLSSPRSACSQWKQSPSGLNSPWAIAFLPDGRILVTERPGRLRIVAGGKLSPPLTGVPKVFASSQGGLHDVTLDHSFAQNQTIYFCFADPHDGGGRTSMARARLAGDRLDDVRVIFRQEGPPSSGRHFGCRIVQTPDNNLFLTLGDHGSYPQEAQNLGNHIGKIVRVGAGRRGAERQSVRRTQGRQAGNLDLRQPQCAGRGAASRNRQAVDARARPAGR